MTVLGQKTVRESPDSLVPSTSPRDPTEDRRSLCSSNSQIPLFGYIFRLGFLASGNAYLKMCETHLALNTINNSKSSPPMRTWFTPQAFANSPEQWWWPDSWELRKKRGNREPRLCRGKTESSFPHSTWGERLEGGPGVGGPLASSPGSHWGLGIPKVFVQKVKGVGEGESPGWEGNKERKRERQGASTFQGNRAEWIPNCIWL